MSIIKKKIKTRLLLITMALTLVPLFFLSFLSCTAAQVFDITKYGAIGDGKTSADKVILHSEMI